MKSSPRSNEGGVSIDSPFRIPDKMTNLRTQAYKPSFEPESATVEIESPGLRLDDKEVLKRALIIKNTGFDLSSPTAIKTMAGVYQKKPISLTNRVDAFLTEGLRKKSYIQKSDHERAKMKGVSTKRTASAMSMTEIAEQEVAREAYEREK